MGLQWHEGRAAKAAQGGFGHQTPGRVALAPHATHCGLSPQTRCRQCPPQAKVEWRGGETEFLESLLPNTFPEDLQPLGNCGHDVLVFHNGFLAKVPQGADRQARLARESYDEWKATVHAPPLPCKSDGW